MKIKYKTPEEKWLDTPRWGNGVFTLNAYIPVLMSGLTRVKTNDTLMLKLIRKRYKKIEIIGNAVKYEN